MTPTARSLKWWRERGYLADKVEQRLPIPHKFVTRDLFGFIDLIAIKGAETIGVQVTSASNRANRITKIRQLAAAAEWGKSRKIVVQGWAKRGARGKRKVWAVSNVEVIFDHAEGRSYAVRC